METSTKEYAHPDMLADTDWLFAHLQDPTIRIVDTENREVYRRAHITGAVGYTGNPFKAAPVLHEMFQQAGVAPNKEVITYCQGGIRAAHSLFSLRLLGYDKGCNYDGSWAEWGNREDLPVER